MKYTMLAVALLALLTGCRAGTIATMGATEAMRPGSTLPGYQAIPYYPSPFLYAPNPFLPPLGFTDCRARPDFLGGYRIQCY